MNRTIPRQRQAGLTLVELMISIVLGLLILSALIALLVNLNRNNDELTKTNRMIENGRVAVQLLESDIVHAGYWGGFVPRFDDLINAAIPNDAPTGNPPDPCQAYGAAWNVAAYRNGLIGVPLHSYEVASPVPVPAIPVCAAPGVGPVQNAVGNSDVVVVRFAEKCTTDCLTAAPAGNQALFMQVQRCGSTLANLNYELAQSGFTFQNVRCNGPSELRRFTSKIYFVATVAGSPVLMVSEFGVVGGVPAFQPAQPLVDGIESIRIEYGLDTLSRTGAAVQPAAAITWADPTNEKTPTNRGDGVPDGNFVRCTSAVPCTAEQLSNAVVARIHVLARAEQASPGYTDTKTYNLGGVTLGPFGDRFKRHVFTQTVRLSNIAGRRETPP